MINDFKEIDNLSPGDFEFFVRDVFVGAGWTDAVVTKAGVEYAHGDGGVDIFAKKGEKRFAIEVKQRAIGTTVDVKALNQLVTGAKLANVQNLILVTNSYFTSEVIGRALRLGVELIDRDKLQSLFIEKHSEIGRRIKPRIYQQSVIDECVKLYKNGKRRILIEMATGLGKTYTAACLIKQLIENENKAPKVLFIVHQVEILLQSITSFKNVFGVGNFSFSACFDGAEPENTDFIFATFDTLFIKMNSIDAQLYDYIIVDEAHHVPAKTYAAVINNLSPQLLIGLTATPYRFDNKDVLKFFGGEAGHVGKYDLAWGLKHKKLAFPKYLVLLDDLDPVRIRQLKSGMSIQDIDRYLFLHKKDEEVVRIIEETIENKQIENIRGIVFCRSINHMKHFIQFFPAGSATLAHSKMSQEQRRENIRHFREGEYKYILTCDLFNEGIDIPEANLLIFLRYTGSRTIWLQQLGRGLRKTNNKEYVHVLDFVGSLERLNEVQQFSDIVKNTPVDKREIQEQSEDKTYHDYSLDVTYNKSAAEVLQLIEELKFRLHTRAEAINALQQYVEFQGIFPTIEQIENALTDFTYDQISTLFDSYYGFIKSAFEQQYDFSPIKAQLESYVENFLLSNKVLPSFRAISLANQHGNLLLCTEIECKQLLGPLEKYQNKSHELTETKADNVSHFQEENQNNNIINNEIPDPQAELLIKQYLDVIKTPRDLLALSNDVRSEIREIFKSEFLFVKIITERNSKNK